MLYSYDSILMCMTNLSIYTFVHLNFTVSFKEAHERVYPPNGHWCLNSNLLQSNDTRVKTILKFSLVPWA